MLGLWSTIIGRGVTPSPKEQVGSWEPTFQEYEGEKEHGRPTQNQD